MCYEAANDHDWRLEVLERPAGSKSFVVIKKRWVVERTFAWLVANRRLARDYERKSCHSEAFIYLAMDRLLVARLVNCLFCFALIKHALSSTLYSIF